MTNTSDSWPAGATYVFQGTIAEDASAGTHVCSLTVTPGVGNEMELLYGRIVNGNTATAQLMEAFITDGANAITFFLGRSDTSALTDRSFPALINTTTNTSNTAVGVFPFIISGAMQLVMRVTTAAVSVTQTFAVACRTHGAKPTAVLADTVGTPTLITNTDKVF